MRKARRPLLGLPPSLSQAMDASTRLRRTTVLVAGRLSCSGEGTVQPAFGDHLLLVGDGGGDLAVYDSTNGRQIWCDDESGSITSAPAVMHDTVYTNGGDTIAVDQTTGVRRWTFTPANFSPLTQTPAIANGVVYVTGGSSVFALDQATGQKFGGTTSSSKPTCQRFPLPMASSTLAASRFTP